MEVAVDRSQGTAGHVDSTREENSHEWITDWKVMLKLILKKQTRILAIEFTGLSKGTSGWLLWEL